MQGFIYHARCGNAARKCSAAKTFISRLSYLETGRVEGSCAS